MSTRRKSVTGLSSIGGGTALNFINTLRMKDAVLQDTLQTDGDVRLWLKNIGLGRSSGYEGMQRGVLLAKARELRSVALAAVRQKKATGRFDARQLNRILREAQSFPRLEASGTGLTLKRVYSHDSPADCLAQVAEAIAEFCVAADFEYVHQCAGADCVLWFSDESKGHRRRFCSESRCGTRARVAAFRAREATKPELPR